MFYRVLVKRPTRKGGEVVVDRVVEFDGNGYELNSILGEGYYGLILEINEIKNIKKIETSVKHGPPNISVDKKEVKTSRLKLKIKLNDEEKVAHASASKALSDYLTCVSDLNSMVEKRLCKQLETFGYVTEVDTFRKNNDYSSPVATLVLNGGMTEFTELIDV